jgi:molybdenum cofactor guanylyltransferase
MPFPAPVLGVLLAGGQARRMGGGDKCLLPLGGRPILAHVIERAAPQVDTLLINANGDPGRFDAFGLPVAADAVPGFAGPLAGVLTGMLWARDHRPDLAWVASFATDTPFFPGDLVRRLLDAAHRDGADLACAASGGRAHPVFGLWPIRLADDLERAMAEDDIRKVDLWTARHRLIQVDFASEPFDPFFNTNRPDDLAAAERLLARGSGSAGPGAR